MKQNAKSLRATAKTLRNEAEKLDKLADKLDPPATSKPRRMVVKQNAKPVSEMTAAEKRKLGAWGGKGQPKAKPKRKLSKGG